MVLTVANARMLQVVADVQVFEHCAPRRVVVENRMREAAESSVCLNDD